MRPEIVLVVTALALAAGCGSFGRNFTSQMEGDPIGDWAMLAARVPATSGGACVSKCKQRDDACYKRISAPGRKGNAQDQEECHEELYQCYAACPHSTVANARYKDLKFSDAVARICRQGVPAGQKVHCMVRNGLAGQVVDPD